MRCPDQSAAKLRLVVGVFTKANPHENGFDAIDPIRLAEQRLDATPRTPYPLQREALHVIDMLKAAVAKQAAMACLNLIEKGPAP